MVYTYVEDGVIKGMSVSCTCGCTIIEFRVCDDEIYISSHDSSWYGHQGLGTLRDRIKHICNALKREKHQVLSYVLMNGNDIDRFLDFADQIEFEKEREKLDSVLYENDAHLALSCDYFDEHCERNLASYALEFRSDMSLKDTILHEHRGYEICLKKSEWESLIHKMKVYLRMMDETHLK